MNSHLNHVVCYDKNGKKTILKWDEALLVTERAGGSVIVKSRYFTSPAHGLDTMEFKKVECYFVEVNEKGIWSLEKFRTLGE